MSVMPSALGAAVQTSPAGWASADVAFAAPAVSAACTAAASSCTVAVFGLGGLGVVGLTRLLCEALLLRFQRAASTETRGIAQRRAPVRSVVRAGSAVRSATPPGESLAVVVALEAGEALRAAPLLPAGSLCVLSDLVLPVSVPVSVSGGAPAATPGQVQAVLEARGVKVFPLRVTQWLAQQRSSDALTSTIAFGAVAGLQRLPLEACERLIEQRAPAAQRAQNLAAFRWGAAQAGALPMLAAVPAATAAAAGGNASNVAAARNTAIAPAPAAANDARLSPALGTA